MLLTRCQASLAHRSKELGFLWQSGNFKPVSLQNVTFGDCSEWMVAVRAHPPTWCSLCVTEFVPVTPSTCNRECAVVFLRSDPRRLRLSLSTDLFA